MVASVFFIDRAFRNMSFKLFTFSCCTIHSTLINSVAGTPLFIISRRFFSADFSFKSSSADKSGLMYTFW